MYKFLAIIGLIAGVLQGIVDPHTDILQGACIGFIAGPLGWFFLKRICIETIHSAFHRFQQMLFVLPCLL